jgi:hypothetical protein
MEIKDGSVANDDQREKVLVSAGQNVAASALASRIQSKWLVKFAATMAFGQEQLSFDLRRYHVRKLMRQRTVELKTTTVIGYCFVYNRRRATRR